MYVTTAIRRFALVTLVAGGAAALGLACGGDTPMNGGNGGGGVASVSVTPAEDSIGVGATTQFTASAEDADGGSVSTSFSWSSTNTSVATVDDQGVATGQDDGMAEIVATAEGEADTAQLTVSGEADATFLVGDNYFEDPQGRRNTSASLELTLGDTVRWEWVDNGNSHNVTNGEGEGGDSGDGVPDGGGPLSSSTQSSGNYEFIPETTGTWEFYCGVHPSTMYGSTFTVNSSGSSSVVADAGSGARDLEPGDVIRPEDSNIVFIYRGKTGGSE